MANICEFQDVRVKQCSARHRYLQRLMGRVRPLGEHKVISCCDSLEVTDEPGESARVLLLEVG